MNLKRLFVSFLVTICISGIVFLVLNDFGITWDEPIYMSRAGAYIDWIKKPTTSDRDHVFKASLGDVHPPFRVLLGGITHEIFTNNLRIIDNTRGYRISSLLFVVPFLIVFTYMAIGQFGYVIGVLAPFVFSLMPHVLFLTPLFTLDYAVAVLWFLTVVFAIKGMKNYGWLTLSGFTLGLLLVTKFHGVLLAVPIAGLWLWYFEKKKNKVQGIVKLFYLGVLALLVVIALWPWLWSSTIPHLISYVQLQLQPRTVPAYIFGQAYGWAPWWYTPIMFLVTTPAFVLIFFAIGSFYALKKGSVWDKIMLANAVYPILFFSLPGVYRYDWIRLFLPAYPFVVLVTARGMKVTISWFKKDLRQVGVISIIFLWFVTLFFSVIRIHPWESAYYNEFVGGIAGANRLGFETEYWGNSYMDVLSWMNLNKKTMMCVWPDYQPMSYYLAMGQLEPGVVFDAKDKACKYQVVLMRQGYFYYNPMIEHLIKNQKPVYTVTVDGVILVGVYKL